MNHPPNPFADDARLVEATRAAPPAADSLDNPYASPATPADHNTEQNGFWRDGEKLVVQEGARLPQCCIKCGCPTERVDPFPIRWSRPIDICTWTLNLHLSICKTCQASHESVGYFRMLTVLVCIVLFVGGLFWTAHLSDQGSWARWVVLPAAVIASLPFFYLCYQSRKKFLAFRVVKCQDNLHWLTGPAEPFLSQLPKLPT